MIYLANINLSQNELQNAVIQPLATAPANPKLGQIYCNSASSKIMWYNGTKWQTVGVVVESSATNGKIKVDGTEMTVYSLPIASADTLGGIKVGTGLGIGADGKLYVTGDATVNSVNWDVVQDTPTTLEGYGITDAVAKETGKGLSTNDYTTAEKTKLSGIAAGAEVNVQANWTQTTTTADDYIKNKPTLGTMAAEASADYVKKSEATGYGDILTATTASSTYVAKNGTDRLMTAAEGTKLANIASGAEVNVQSDWNQTTTSADDYIKNKPTALSAFTNDSNFIDSSVNNLANYYLKTETYTQTEVNTLIGQIATIQVQVVASLPASGQKSNIIYLVAKTAAETQNGYDEYLWTGTAFEKIGDTTIDLSSYLTTSGNASSTTVAFTSATSRDNIATGESMATLMGKIKKVFDDIKGIAFSGSYVDLTNKPMEVVSTTKTLAAGQTSLNVEWVQNFTVPKSYASTISMSLMSYKAYLASTGEEVQIDMTQSLLANEYNNTAQNSGSGTTVGYVESTKTAQASLSLTFSIAKAYTENITIDIFAAAKL